MPAARRRRRIRMGMAGVAIVTIMAATGGTAMGWMMGGTTEAIETYKRTAVAKVPEGDRSPTRSATVAASSPHPATSGASVDTTQSPAPAYFPANGTTQWATTVAPGQALSGLSVRNGDTDTNLIAHLTARRTDGGWMPVASMTVSPGREAILRPPPGDYAMELVASPVTLAYDRIASLPRSPAVSFALAPQPQDATPAVRFSVSRGRIDRLPDATGSPSRPAVTPVRRDVAPGPSAEPKPAPKVATSMREDAPAPMMADTEDDNPDARTYTDGSGTE